jgi:hypothetical protein
LVLGAPDLRHGLLRARVSLGAVVAIIFADLITIPILIIDRKVADQRGGQEACRGSAVA